MNIEILASQLAVSKNDIVKALTHQSFYKVINTNKCNSRLVFLGMFVFKGQVAEVLAKYYNGTGTQLQHGLGNLFKNELLSRFFDLWNLSKWIRVGENFDWKAHKHIFVYAIFGQISLLDEKSRQKFIFKYIINDKNQHILQHVVKNRNFLQQANIIARHLTGKNITTNMELTIEGLHKATIMLKDNTIICSAESKSYKYARKKAMKTALLILSNSNFEKYANESDYFEKIKNRLELENEKKQILIQQKIEEKEKRRLENIEKSKRIKIVRDKARREAQADAKKRKEQKKALLAKQAANSQKPVSANKRRFLEDKKK